jgi:hypothetical protein
MTTTPDFRALLVELTELQGHVLVECTEEWADVMDRVRAALATPPPEPPTVMEILELSDEIEDAGLGQIDLVRAALERWGAK